MRVVVADDETLPREGLVRLLAEAGFEVVGTAADAPGLLRLVKTRAPDLALVDIKMPPDHKEEGIAAAHEIRRSFPGVGVLVLSHYLESRYAMLLVEELPERSGCLLKDRVSEIGVLTDALRRIAQGECVIDPTIVSRLVRHRRNIGPLSELTQRERDILELMAEGHSNEGVCDRLFLSQNRRRAHQQPLLQARHHARVRLPPPRPRGARVPAGARRRAPALRGRHSLGEHAVSRPSAGFG